MLRHRIEILRHPSRDPALSIRFEMWQVAWRMIKKHPLVGVGPNSIEQVYALYLPPGKSPEPGYHGHLHNNFFQFGAERGLPTLAAWVWLMAALGWQAWRVGHRLAKGSRLAWVADATLAGWLALLVEGCFEFNFGTSPVLMLFLFAASIPFVAERTEHEEQQLGMGVC
jgi:O-antigen ligase